MSTTSEITPLEMPGDLLPLLRTAVRIAHRAGERILELYGSDRSFTLKADRSPVTAADRAAHEVIRSGLCRSAPGIPILSEESPDEDRLVRDGWRRFWLVDPLDGTKEFLKRSGEFTVNIAMIENGTPMIGVVHVPVLGVTYHAAHGVGAYRLCPRRAPVRIRTRRSDPARLTVVASRDHAGPIVAAMLERLRPQRTVSVGSSLKFCMVADGRADLYPRDVPTMEWDTAAAQCVVGEAGGRVIDFDGNPLLYGKTELKNPSILTIGDPALDCMAVLR